MTLHIHSLRYPHFLIFIFNWGKIAPQCCVSFCHTTVEISHNYTFITSLLSLLPLPSSYLSGSSESTRLGSLCYTATYHLLSVLHMGVYICWWYFLHLYHSLPPAVSTSPFSISEFPFLPYSYYKDFQSVHPEQELAWLCRAVMDACCHVVRLLIQIWTK